MERLVPREVIKRPKRPFATPYDDWLRASLGTELERRVASASGLRGVVAEDMVGRLIADHRSGRSDHKRILYCLLELAFWHEHFVANGRGPVPVAAGVDGRGADSAMLLD